MPTIPFIQSFATLTASVLLLGGIAWAQPTESPEVAGINLTTLRNTGYRIDWMTQSTSTKLRMPTITNRSMYVLDGEDYLSRYDLKSGKWLWSTPIGNQVFILHSITEFPEIGQLYVLSDGATYVVEIATGNYPSQANAEASTSHASKQHMPLEWVASTGALRDGGYLVYGSSKGDTIWFNPSIGFTVHRYRIGSTIHSRPTLVQGIRDPDGLMRRVIVTASKDGRVVAVDANQINRLWSLTLLGAVETPVTFATNNRLVANEAIPRTSVFIAGSDQYLRAVDLHTGRPRWKVLTTAPLADTPLIHEQSLYQRIPSVGLACFDAFPVNISGKQKWVAEDVTGIIITTTTSGRLVSWDQENRLLQIIEPKMGGVVSSLSIPTAKSLISDNDTNGSLYIITDDEMLIRLAPRQ